MDLIYTDENRNDVGILLDYDFDFAFGSDENDFECTIVKSSHCCQPGSILYFEGTEYGGIVDSITTDTATDDVVYKGRTFHGIMNSKIIEPDNGEAYLKLNGEANTVIGALITRLELDDMFTVSSVASGFTFSNYKVPRYIEGYFGIAKALKSLGAKLKMSCVGGVVSLSAVAISDYSQDEEIDSSVLPIKSQKTYNKINHLICLGSGELEERLVVNLYADSNGNISQTKTETGIEDYSAIYEYSTISDMDELIAEGTSKLKEVFNADIIDVDMNADEDIYDVGDVLGTYDSFTNISVKKTITKKILSISNGILTVQYKTDTTQKANALSGGTNGGVDDPGSSGGITKEQILDMFYPVGTIYETTVGTFNPNSSWGGTWEKIEGKMLLGASSDYAIGTTGGEATHTLTIQEMPSHNHTYARSGYTSGAEWIGGSGTSTIVTGNTGNAGGGQAHNNMPPYQAVNIWKRTA